MSAPSSTRLRGADGDPGGSPAAMTGDSIRVATWTVVSRVTGVFRIAAIGAVLGPTFFGNAYQFTNSLPNLVYYGFLAGSLFSSLLVPAIVRYVDSGDSKASARVSGGFLGLTLIALTAAAPVMAFLGPLMLRYAAGPSPHPLVGLQQEHLARLLILMFIPQVFFYAVVGTSSAVMNANGRFALAAAAPAIENLGTLAVLGATASLFGPWKNLSDIPNRELLLLGLGSTGAVGLHAATQWWGASRVGVRVRPRWGWRDEEVRIVLHRALPSVAQAGLVAAQVICLMAAANRIPGGVVAFQIALNFFYLAIAIGATPVALSLLPRLSRLNDQGDDAAFRTALARGLSLGFFITVPAAAGYEILAHPLARAVSFGRMESHEGVALLTAALLGLGLAAVGQMAFVIATYASYARRDTRSPLESMVLQAAVCLALSSLSWLFHGTGALLFLGAGYSASIMVSSCHLTRKVSRGLRDLTRPLGASLTKVGAGVALMSGPAWVAARSIPGWLGSPMGSRVGIVVASLVGAGVFVAVQAMLGAQELTWLTDGLRQVFNLRPRELGTPSDAG